MQTNATTSTSGIPQNQHGNGNFQRGGFRASAGSRYSEWMGVSSGVGSSSNSQVSSFAPISALSTKTSSTSNTSYHQQAMSVNGGELDLQNFVFGLSKEKTSDL